jgi:hypothetical protein
MPITKLETSDSKINGLKGSKGIKSGVVVKETFKDWKALLISTPHEKG